LAETLSKPFSTSTNIPLMKQESKYASAIEVGIRGSWKQKLKKEVGG